jgi:rubrerythrin
MTARGPMTDKEKQLFEAFKVALDAERAAQGKYGEMAAMADDPEIRRVFEQFQREETEHEEGLLRLYGDFKARFIRE